MSRKIKCYRLRFLMVLNSYSSLLSLFYNKLSRLDFFSDNECISDFILTLTPAHMLQLNKDQPYPVSVATLDIQLHPNE